MSSLLEMLSDISPHQNRLTPEQEDKFQKWIRALPWFGEFKNRYGSEPDLNTPDYDYRAAFLQGITPQRYKFDNNMFHWPSVAPNGMSLKGKNHPTLWMETFMQKTGVDPNSIGLKDQNQANEYLKRLGH